jgi:hypothetical protein
MDRTDTALLRLLSSVGGCVPDLTTGICGLLEEFRGERQRNLIGDGNRNLCGIAVGGDFRGAGDFVRLLGTEAWDVGNVPILENHRVTAAGSRFPSLFACPRLRSQ